MTGIDDEVVEHVARRLTGRPPGGSAERLLRDQPEALAFLLAGTAQLSPNARTVGVFLGDVIVESFVSAGRGPRPIRPADLVASLKQNREMALRVGAAHDKIAERYLRNSNTLRQPALIRYVTGVLLEDVPTCPHEVPRDELGPLFIVLKSIIDVLDADGAAVTDELPGS
jgi:hypothetical protein